MYAALKSGACSIHQFPSLLSLCAFSEEESANTTAMSQKFFMGGNCPADDRRFQPHVRAILLSFAPANRGKNWIRKKSFGQSKQRFNDSILSSHC